MINTRFVVLKVGVNLYRLNSKNISNFKAKKEKTQIVIRLL